MADNKVNDRYKGIPADIAKELEKDDVLYFREDKPVPFCGLNIYPIKVRDYEVFCNCSACCTLNRKESVEGLKMSDLEFLLLQVGKENEGPMWSYRIQKLFELVFRISNGLKCKNPECNHLIGYESQDFLNYVAEIQKPQQENTPPPQLLCPKCGGKEFSEMIKFCQDEQTKKYYLLIDGHKITHQDFKKFRQIVLFQNFPDYHDDTWIDPALKQDYEARLELQRKKNNNVSATIEEKVVGLSLNSNYKFDEIFDMTIRKFTIALAMVDDLINYKITKQASMSGLVSLPKNFKLEHWLYKESKDMYGDAYKDMDALKNDVRNL